MDLKLSSCAVLVHDLGQALAFYRDVLGFEVRSDTEFEGMRWASVGPPSQPGLDIVLIPPGAPARLPAPGQFVARPGRR